MQPVLLGGSGARAAGPGARALRLHRAADQASAVRVATRARWEVPLRRSEVCYDTRT